MLKPKDPSRNGVTPQSSCSTTLSACSTSVSAKIDMRGARFIGPPSSSSLASKCRSLVLANHESQEPDTPKNILLRAIKKSDGSESAKAEHTFLCESLVGGKKLHIKG